jgi:hypothetical protein
MSGRPVVTAATVLDFLKASWDHTVFKAGEEFYPDSCKCENLAYALRCVANSEARPPKPKRKPPPIIEYGCKFLKKLPAERAIIETELEALRADADTENPLIKLECDRQEEILADLAAAEQAINATLRHWGIPARRRNPALFIFETAKSAWDQTIIEQGLWRGNLNFKPKVPLSANHGSPMTAFIGLALKSVGIEGYGEDSIIAAVKGKRVLARREGKETEF